MKNKKRLFLHGRGRRIKRRLTVLTGIVGGLAACAPATEYWTPAESPKINRVDWVEFHHRVAFEPGSDALAGDEAARLDRFLLRFADDRPPSARILVRGPEADDTALSRRREAAVLASLRDTGLKAKPVRAGEDAVALAPGGVLVTIGRHVVTPPRCPDWSKPADGDPANQVGSNFGCATATNLGLMVADPATLLRGSLPGPADGEALAASIEAYRSGRTATTTEAASQDPFQGGATGERR